MTTVTDPNSSDVYQAILLEHFRHPRNTGILSPEVADADAHNPLCGDRIRLQLERDNDRITGMIVDCKGCAICIASSSIMSESINGLTVSEAHELNDTVLSMLTATTDAPAPASRDLAALHGIRRYPMRLKCAALPWVALRESLAP